MRRAAIVGARLSAILTPVISLHDSLRKRIMKHARMSPDRLPALDGLRAVSILLVCYSHTFQLLHVHHLPGTYGVTIFFFISGFIITRLLLGESLDTGTVKLAPFYIRRWFRLTPPLLVYVLLSVVVMGALGQTVPGSDVKAVLFYYANYHDIMSGFTTYSTSDTKSIYSPFVITWSLAVEEHFYFLFPLLLLALRSRTKSLGRVLLAFVVFTLAWRAYLAYGIGDQSLPFLRIYKGTDTRLDSIAFGCLLSVLFHRAALGHAQEARLLDSLRGYRGVCLGAALFLASMLPKSVPFNETFGYSLQGAALAALFCSLFRKEPAQFLKSLLELRPLLFLGAISYSLYLYHYLAFVVVQIVLKDPLVQVLGAWLLAFAGALFSYYCIEGPSRRFGAELAQKTGPRSLVTRRIEPLSD